MKNKLIFPIIVFSLIALIITSLFVASTDTVFDNQKEVKKGDFTVIMGSSGSGKSTLLYNLSGMDTPTQGEIHFCDKRIDSLSGDELAAFRRRDIGFIFQQMHLEGAFPPSSKKI